MNFETSNYVLWCAFTFLQAIGLKYIRKPELRLVRWFMGFCLVRDMVWFAFSCSPQHWWDVGWTGKEIELVFLAAIIGNLIEPGRLWRFPAFSIAALEAHYLITKQWPFYATGEQMQTLQQSACLMMFGTLLIGSVFVLKRNQLEIALGLALLVAADMISATSYLEGHYSVHLVGCIWVAATGILVAVGRANPAPKHRIRSFFRAAVASNSETRSRTPSEQQSESTPRDEFSRQLELLEMYCPSKLQ